MTRAGSLPLLIIFLFIASENHARGGPYMDSARIECVRQAQEHLFNDRFTEVDSIYAIRIQENPGDPLGYVFRAGALFSEMSDREENLHGELFLSLLDSTESIAARVIDTCDATTAAWMYLFRGHARAYRSLWESRFGSLMSALRLALSTIDEYEAGLAVNPELYDLYAGSGSYHYWKSAKAGLLKWLGIFKDEKDKGITELRLAADSSLLHQDLARSALIWIWLDRHEYDSAAALAEQFAGRYPDGKTFRWPLAQARYRQEEYEQAAGLYGEIRALLLASPGNYYNLIQCDYHIARCYSWSEQPIRAIEAARSIKEYEALIPDYIVRRQAAKLNYLRRLAKRRNP
jgi:hypothetical protein